MNKAQDNPEVIKTDSKKIASPYDCYQQLKSHFESEKWLNSHKHKSISKINFFWAGLTVDDTAGGMIRRPPQKEFFDRINGIRKSYQYFMLKGGEVGVRKFGCWCAGCSAQAQIGPIAHAGFYVSLEVPKCMYYETSHKSVFTWQNQSCAKVGSAAKHRRDVAKTNGRRIAADLVPGDWCLFEARNSGEDLLWLARAVGVDEWDGSCTKLHEGNTKTLDGIQYNEGDTKVAIQWYSVLPESTNRDTFTLWEEGDVEVQNSSELRLSKFEMVLHTGTSVRTRLPRGKKAEIEEFKREKMRKWKLDDKDHAIGLRNCDEC